MTGQPAGDGRLPGARRRWRGFAADAALAAGMLAFGLVGTAGAAANAGVVATVGTYSLVAVAALVLAGRRRRPATTLAVSTAATLAYLLLGYPYGPILVAFFIAVYSVAAHLPLCPAAVAGGVALAVLLLCGFVGARPLGLLGLMPAAAWVVVPFAVGVTARLGRESTAQTRAEQARELADGERLRVAREVHDVVGHGLAAIHLQAEIALHLLAKRPEQAETALRAISRTSKEALDELRVTLTVVRRDDGGAPRAPTPGLDQLPQLRERLAGAGVPVTVTVEGELRPLPVAVDLAAYRVVQESLTNVLRHAGHATAAVLLRYAPASVVVEVDRHRPQRADRARSGRRDRAGRDAGTGHRARRHVRRRSARRWRFPGVRHTACRGGFVISVLLADDQELVRIGLRALLESEDDIGVAGEAADGLRAVELARSHRPDVVLMDVRMPGVDGIEATRRIVADPALAGTRVVVLTTFELDEYVFDALRHGASGFLTKDTAPAELLRAVRLVAEGEALLSPSVTRRVVREFATRPARVARPHPRLDALTDREREVVGLVGEGLSNAEIAERLVVSPATARTHVSRAMVKLAARDRAQLVVFAYQSGLVTS